METSESTPKNADDFSSWLDLPPNQGHHLVQALDPKVRSLAWLCIVAMVDILTHCYFAHNFILGTCQRILGSRYSPGWATVRTVSTDGAGYKSLKALGWFCLSKAGGN